MTKLGKDIIDALREAKDSTERMIVNNIGYTQKLFEQLGAKRTCPTWIGKNKQPGQPDEYSINDDSIPNDVKEYIYTHDENKIIREAMSNAFMQHVHTDNTYLYKLSVALAELHLGELTNYDHQFSGILYPSLSVGAEGDNLALLPDFVDTKLIFKKAVHIKIEDKLDKHVKITSLDHASSFSEDGIYIG